jgi:hypothetical protein
MVTLYTTCMSAGNRNAASGKEIVISNGPDRFGSALSLRQVALWRPFSELHEPGVHILQPDIGSIGFGSDVCRGQGREPHREDQEQQRASKLHAYTLLLTRTDASPSPGWTSKNGARGQVRS